MTEVDEAVTTGDVAVRARDGKRLTSYAMYGNSALSRLVRAGLLTGLIDGTFSSVLSVVFYDSTVVRLFQGVASTLIGADAFNGGTSVAALGVLMHFGVAFGWSAVFSLLVLRSHRVRRLLGDPFGVIKVAAVYGPFIWLVMSLAVIPLLTQGPPTVNIRWWVQLVGHFPFVGIPIVASIGGGRSPRVEPGVSATRRRIMQRR